MNKVLGPRSLYLILCRGVCHATQVVTARAEGTAATAATAVSASSGSPAPATVAAAETTTQERPDGIGEPERLRRAVGFYPQAPESVRRYLSGNRRIRHPAQNEDLECVQCSFSSTTMLVESRGNDRPDWGRFGARPRGAGAVHARVSRGGGPAASPLLRTKRVFSDD
ncbi:protein E31C [Proboscivirus elephantidbeta4]|uniref:Protein E31C n=1 Tax=Elephant endotheliotropic herpesvirus 4 TaxID=548914 RepID=A0A0S1TKW2_9BETA|nr:protein E31C [Elephant endotheliotropic herpesvirus 4]ALM26043.1 protein E31C [Elephant endotheliotropic herpesvirus 4]